MIRLANQKSAKRAARTPVSNGQHAKQDKLDQRELLSALRALRRGDFGARLPEGLSDVDGQICDVLNDIMEHSAALRREILALNQNVVIDGMTRRRLTQGALHGGWLDYATSVNELLDGLTNHSNEVVRVVTAVSRGDLSQTIDVDGGSHPLKGEFLSSARTVNGMVQQLANFGSQVTQVAHEVGVEGKLGAQARVEGVSGAWKEVTDSVNRMASNLTTQVREIARVTTAVAQGDLTKTIGIEVQGEILELKNTINTMVDQLSSFADEVTRVSREVGTEGVLGGQAQVRGVSGVWRELTENVNFMAQNLTDQVRNIAEVSAAIAAGNLSKKITVEVRGEILELKNTINTMVDQLSSFADEVTRVSREVGTDGILGGQAKVRGASGVWGELTENVNFMANNLTDQVRNIAEVVTAIAEGDLSRKITVDARGEILTLKDTINATVDKLSRFSSEVTRVARLVGTEGTLGVQAEVRDVSGVWRELTENVNLMGRNLTDQVRDIAVVTTAVANGDLSRKITVEVKGEILTLKNTINAMVDSLSSFADEVTRMAREVGTEGVLGGQAVVHGVSGVWKELTHNVNSMASNLTDQVRNIAGVARAVAQGDLSRKITVHARGEVLDLKETINDMVDQLNAFGAEVTRVAREVGVEGKLGGQAEVAGVQGIWSELTENVNLMASNLTNQVRDIAGVTTAVARGDLTRKIQVDARGEILELKNTINIMVDQLGAFAEQVTRLASDVGIEGKLGGQADVEGVSGTWRDLTDAVNSMANNLTTQVRNIAQVATAIAQGDLKEKIVVDARGEILELKNTINTMVDQLSAFAQQVTLVSREVGTEGKLGGQAAVEGVRGTWKELTDNVNLMASNLTAQVRDVSRVSSAIARGDLDRKVTVEVRGEFLDLKNTINTMVDQLSSFADEVARVARDVGVEGKLGGQAEVRGVSGIWKELTDNVNLMASNLTAQVRDIATVTTAVANGDLSRKIKVEVRGEILELKNTINTMVDQLSSFADEVTRVAREVGTDGILGGLAEVRGVSGTWRELTDNVNVMAQNLTEQVRGIATVVTAVANGDLKQQLTLEAKGEIATLVDTINNMIVTLSKFADQVTSVARDVGVEGKLGGQADVPGAAGLWRDLTNNVNELAGNLTRQVRAIGDVATAVTKGDLTQSISVEARGELALLKDNLNQMILTLAGTTRVNQEQDWLKTNLARFTRMLQGQRALISVAEQVLSELAPVMDSQYGAFYTCEKSENDAVLKLCAAYAGSGTPVQYALGESLVGQAAVERKRILLSNLPPNYLRIGSALGEASPSCLVVAPIVFEGEVKGVIELAAFKHFSPIQLAFLEQLIDSLGIVVATIEATMRTDELLRQSQGLTEELRTGQEELKLTNEQLEEKARQLTEQKAEVEKKNREVERAKQELEEKADQLAMTSRYKSQFLANMSHELRTPLNSLLILSRQLAENHHENLSERQVEYARTIHHSGADLLSLINEILDLAKIESGTIALEMRPVRLAELHDFVERSFRQIADEKGLAFGIEMSPDLPEWLSTDDMRLKQVLRNLLANALKFTETGSVTLQVTPVHADDFGAESVSLRQAARVIAFSIVDTGIGIAKDKQKIVFEAFQQADGGTSRKFGGTGLGLAISREIAFLLGGELHLSSEPGRGSVFTLYLPSNYVPEVGAAESRPNPTYSKRSMHANLAAPARVQDDRTQTNSEAPVLLMIEDDDSFARTLLGIAREHGFRGVVALTGEDGLELSRRLRPDAITLDLGLPDMDGWVVLDQLKHDPATRQIPVHVISASDEERRGLEQGAIAFLRKPAEESALRSTLQLTQNFLAKKVKQLLLAVSDDSLRMRLAGAIGNSDVHTVQARSIHEALDALRRGSFDCLTLSLELPDGSAADVVRALSEQPDATRLPIIVFAANEPTPNELGELKQLGKRMLVQLVRSPEEFLSRAALFLHRPRVLGTGIDPEGAKSTGRSESGLAGKKALIVDDDLRNVFAMTALLEQFQMQVCFAENGQQALDQLDQDASIDVVLMDIMMPEMDGYEATRRIRQQPRFAKLPVIALTAKAMKGDREKCISAGTSDYITKPIDSDQLLSLLRVWLYEQ